MSPSDKGKRMVVMPVELYKEMAKSHTANDKEISWKELKQIQDDVGVTESGVPNQKISAENRSNG